MTTEQVSELVGGLWTAQFAGEVAKVVPGAQATDTDVLRLAAAMPLSPVRRSFQQLLDARVKGSPEGLIKDGNLADLVRDQLDSHTSAAHDRDCTVLVVRRK